MPPKQKRPRSRRCSGQGCSNSCQTNPRVILQPFLADPSGQKRSHFSTEPPSASLFNKPAHSDLKLKVGQECYYVHKIILCAGSEVFAKMLSEDWADGDCTELELNEEGDCIKVFDRFLYFFYSGSITISETYVIPLFMLADKYDVRSVYDECVKIIEAGLKVYVVESIDKVGVTRPVIMRQDSQSQHDSDSSGSSGSSQSDSATDSCDSSDESTSSRDHHEIPNNDASSPAHEAVYPHHLVPDAVPSTSHSKPKQVHLIGSEIFPISLVVKMLIFWHNERISTAALYNLGARLGNQISQENFSVWNGMSCDLIMQMLSDSHFCYNEYLLFRAAKSWITSSLERQQNHGLVSSVLTNVRFPLLTTQELYQVEKDHIVQACPKAVSLIQDSMKHHLFRNYCSAEDKAKWTGVQFEARKPRTI